MKTLKAKDTNTRSSWDLKTGKNEDLALDYS